MPQIPIEVPIYKFNTHPLLLSPRLKVPHRSDCVINAFEAMGIFDNKTSKIARDLIVNGVHRSVFLKWLDDVEAELAASKLLTEPDMDIPKLKRHQVVIIGLSDMERLLSNLPNQYGMFVIVTSPHNSHIFIIVRWDNQLGIIDSQVMQDRHDYTKFVEIDELRWYYADGYELQIISVIRENSTPS